MVGQGQVDIFTSYHPWRTGLTWAGNQLVFFMVLILTVAKQLQQTQEQVDEV